MIDTTTIQKNQEISDPATVAIVNGESITLQDIEMEIKEREITQVMGKRVAELLNQDILSPQDIEAYYDKEYIEQNKDLKRFIERSKRESTDQPMEKNNAFNILVRKEVLFQEANEQGHYYSLEEVRQIKQELREQSLASIKIGGYDPDAFISLESEVLKEFGYESREKWEEERLPYLARAIAISQLKMQFNEKVLQDNDINDSYIIENLWEDYTEFLIKQADVKILDETLILTFYGEQWQGYKLVINTKSELNKGTIIEREKNQNTIEENKDQLEKALKELEEKSNEIAEQIRQQINKFQ